MEGEYCMSVGIQLNVFHASKLSVWLNYVKSSSTKKNMNHRKHVTPEDVSTSTNLNICNISVWLNYVKSSSTKKNMNHGKHVTPEDVSTSTNLNICNILLHGIK
jgi:hypothetical protein